MEIVKKCRKASEVLPGSDSTASGCAPRTFLAKTGTLLPVECRTSFCRLLGTNPESVLGQESGDFSRHAATLEIQTGRRDPYENLKIFGDSIIKGVTYNGQSYHLCQEHDFDTLRAQGVTVENNAKMGATIDAGLKQLDRKLGTCDGDTTVLFCFGGNDCDYDWKAISEDPDGEHLPHTPSEKFIDQYCTAIRKAQSAGAAWP